MCRKGIDAEGVVVSEEGQAIRFTADDEQLRPMGRATGGVRGMKFKHDDDSVLSLSVIRAAQVAAEDAAGMRDAATVASDLATLRELAEAEA